MSARIALIGDIHYGPDSAYVRGGAAWPLLERALSEIEVQQPEVLIDLGDRINDEALSEARTAMSEVAARFRHLALPTVHLQGNDDTVPRLEQEVLLGVPLGNRRMELGGWQLVFLDTYDGSVEGIVTAQTLGWLERTLAENRLPAAIFSHQPLDGQPLPGNVFFGGEFFYQAHPRGHEAVRRVLERSGKVRLAVSGHSHWNHQVIVAGIPYLTLDALVPLAQEPEDGGVYGLLTLKEDIRLEVFGRSPWRIRLGSEPS